ncbi:PREDICTED: putative cyclin-dependent serine/threonine-protein kinase DDB_G0272797/DDB_G0274007 [Diuraphis noxia]|uniref:putative cyclin-dependent serine/threonine-protein kinase DDB_G0272797/DDB_G0274007 n=1 Tax=Diuraphis noxia TaxID=143948 RepID=UPI0007635A83|nr:PREDICTED: putative cyclin-dependent serine/threonine-protein kinase DDB_G0272797/DDB_G0274007 [Diuraphis noxia]
MFKLVFIAIILEFVLTVRCGPMPRQRIDGEQNHRQEQQKYAVDRFTTGLVGNPIIRENYLNCFLDNGPCSPEANNIKPGMVPEAIQNECAHCTELQRKVIEKMMCYLNNHQPDILKEVAAKFDPNGEYMKQYINTIERNGNGGNVQFLNPNLLQYQPQQNSNQPQQNPNQPQQNPNQPQQNPNRPQQNPNQPQLNPNQPQLHQNQNQYQPQQNQHQPQQNQHQPQQNPNQPQLNPNQPQLHQHQNQYQPQQNQHQPQSNQNQPQSNQYQPQPNLNQPQQNTNQPQPHQHQYQPQQNPNQPQQHQHQHQPQQYQYQPQKHQHEQQLKETVVTTAPISTATRKP